MGLSSPPLNVSALRSRFTWVLGSLTPPLLATYGLGLWRKVFRGIHFYTFEGNWNSIEEVPSGSYDDLELARRICNSRLRNLAVLIQSGGPTPQIDDCGKSILPLMVAMLSRNLPEINVLDVGGGMAVDLLILISRSRGILERTKINYSIVETPAMTEVIAPVLLQHFKEYHRNLTVSVGAIPQKPQHVVNMASALQYMRDWTGTLIRLAECKPSAIVISNTPCCRVKTYATSQRNMPHKTIPLWVINVNQLKKSLADLGYRLIYEEAHDQRPASSRLPPQGEMEFRSFVFSNTDSA